MERNENVDQVLVNGYPRSGNTFLEFALKTFYGNNTRLFRSHSTVDIESNLDKKIFVVIRTPLQSIASWNHFRLQLKIHSEESLTLDADFNYYLRYYNFIEKHFEQVTLMDFAKFSKDSTYITNKVQQKFNKKPSITLDIESLQKGMILKGGANFLPRKPSTTRQQIEDEVLGHPLYKEVLDLHDHLISKDDIHP